MENKMSEIIMSKNQRSFIFGPVPSRRLGRSLGIDLVPFKTCSYDCIYCQLGKTTNKSIQRKKWFPADEILEQLKNQLYLKPDYITLSGSGEPSLYLQCGEIINQIKALTQVPVAVLTNGSLLWLPEVRSALSNADLVIPSLDAGCEQLFRYINRPHKDISFKKMLNGLISFREEYTGKYWLEIFLLAGVNTTKVEMNRLKTCIRNIMPDKVQVNTVTRPPCEEYAEAVPPGRLKKLVPELHDHSEIIADYSGTYGKGEFAVQSRDILSLLQRRPCSIEDISAGLNVHRNEAVKYIEKLCAQGKIRTKRQNQTIYYLS